MVGVRVRFRVEVRVNVGFRVIEANLTLASILIMTRKQTRIIIRTLTRTSTSTLRPNPETNSPLTSILNHIATVTTTLGLIHAITVRE